MILNPSSIPALGMLKTTSMLLLGKSAMTESLVARISSRPLLSPTHPLPQARGQELPYNNK
ncbi:hypothetical protein M8R19_21655 [Pseudomonas sp. R3.Fl]|uniref:hypothetical protein n=1 Tax=Pseudomonas sp. R3.Fl TaxID=2928708 RepID=UPI00201DB4DC|nr:hypothetical protein [Pseudomonas sp. R3.Fl]MCL6691308.1 hypothetical protein [Pseudomonas sp. R3.Fl]